jgi:TolB-like protein/Tfp pilus assembly protein PilF
VRGGAKPVATSSGADQPSIAVLPFVDMSPGKDQEYFSDGIAEEILNVLAQVEGLHVAGRTSSFSFKGKNEDLASIAEKLHVATVLEGSVRKSGNRVRISAQLINARDGFHLWSKQYDRELSDIFAVQAELAAAVVEALKVKLLPTAAPAPKIARARDPEAYRLFLLGRSHEARVTEVAQAEAAYKKATALDPAYARAWASLAEMHGFLATTAPHHEQSRRSREALDEAERAVALNPDLPEAYSTRGYIRGWLFWDWSGAKSDLERAMQLSPGSKDALNNYALFVQKTGRLKEAIALERKVTEVGALDAWGWTNLGALLIQDGQLGAAREAFLRSQEISPDIAYAASYLPLIDLLEGHPAKALHPCRRRRARRRLSHRGRLRLARREGPRLRLARPRFRAARSGDAQSADRSVLPPSARRPALHRAAQEDEPAIRLTSPHSNRWLPQPIFSRPYRRWAGGAFAAAAFGNASFDPLQ